MGIKTKKIMEELVKLNKYSYT
uniref:Cytochrome b6/f complex subunit IV n=1 Tax=Heterorhabditis bacteriophora TaxID=37862 RepID=A0A1I7WZ42_HETBA